MRPNVLSLADLELIKTVYNFINPWKKNRGLSLFLLKKRENRIEDEVTESSQKNRMYQVQESITPGGKGLPNLFSTPNENGTELF
jgi:hypothetical protein